MANRLEGKVAVVTGGDQGIGRAIVERLAAEGADMALCFRSNKAGADEVVALVQKLGRVTSEKLLKASALSMRPSVSWAASISW